MGESGKEDDDKTYDLQFGVARLILLILQLIAILINLQDQVLPWLARPATSCLPFQKHWPIICRLPNLSKLPTQWPSCSLSCNWSFCMWELIDSESNPPFLVNVVLCSCFNSFDWNLAVFFARKVAIRKHLEYLLFCKLRADYFGDSYRNLHS